MAALGIDVSTQEPVTQYQGGSGRLNLAGQKKPDYLVNAIQEARVAQREFLQAVDDCMDSKVSMVALHQAREKANQADLNVQNAHKKWQESFHNANNTTTAL